MENNNVSENNVGSEAIGEIVGSVGLKKDENIFGSIFVTENDTFDICTEFYFENGRLFVKGIDDDFNDKSSISKVIFTIKYPSQADVESISTAFRTYMGNNEKTVFSEVTKLEMIRFFALVRKWSLSEKMSNEKIMSLNPKIIKSILNEIRLKIDMDGII